MPLIFFGLDFDLDIIDETIIFIQIRLFNITYFIIVHKDQLVIQSRLLSVRLLRLEGLLLLGVLMDHSQIILQKGALEVSEASSLSPLIDIVILFTTIFIVVFVLLCQILIATTSSLRRRSIVGRWSCLGAPLSGTTVATTYAIKSSLNNIFQSLASFIFFIVTPLLLIASIIMCIIIILLNRL